MPSAIEAIRERLVKARAEAHARVDREFDRADEAIIAAERLLGYEPTEAGDLIAAAGASADQVEIGYRIGGVTYETQLAASEHVGASQAWFGRLMWGKQKAVINGEEVERIGPVPQRQLDDPKPSVAHRRGKLRRHASEDTPPDAAAPPDDDAEQSAMCVDCGETVPMGFSDFRCAKCGCGSYEIINAEQRRAIESLA